jgi:hypothetical protein
MFLILFITGCTNNNNNNNNNNNSSNNNNNKKQIVCKMNSEGSVLPEIVATLDSNDKVSEIEIRTVYESEEAAQGDFNSFKAVHGDNASINKNVITVKNVQDENTLFGKQYSQTVGYTKDEFQSFLGNYTCE